LIRKDFTISERIQALEIIESREAAKAKKRQATSTGGVTPQHKDSCPDAEYHRFEQTRDKVAKVGGFGCGKTYEKAKKVVKSGNQGLIRLMDETNKVNPAYEKLQKNNQGGYSKPQYELQTVEQKIAIKVKNFVKGLIKDGFPYGDERDIINTILKDLAKFRMVPQYDDSEIKIAEKTEKDMSDGISELPNELQTTDKEGQYEFEKTDRDNSVLHVI
jgi:hypothetical protein